MFRHEIQWNLKKDSKIKNYKKHLNYVPEPTETSS